MIERTNSGFWSPMRHSILFFFILVQLQIALPGERAQHESAKRWDWASLSFSADDLAEWIAYPTLALKEQGKKQPFLWGVASCKYQDCGADNCPTNQWSAWEKTKKSFGRPTIRGGQRSGVSNDTIHHQEEDVGLLNELGVNAHRYSVEWANIEPEEGQFNEEELQKEVAYCDMLLARGITPMITLYHFTHPVWFEKKGGFEKEENIAYYVRFCTKVFDYLKGRVPFICTMNEPTVLMLLGYLLGEFPPGKFMNITLGGTVLKNLMKGHCQVYRTLKALPGGQETNIGIVHAVLKFEAYNPWNPLVSGICNYLTKIKHYSVMNFFKTGLFHFDVPCSKNIIYVDYDAPKCLDFFGLNYYSRAIISDFFDGTCYTGEVMTDMEYASFPKGLYDAIVEVSALKVPMYITENGIADAKDNRREKFIAQYIYALAQARKDGYDVRGYFYWSLLDNFEWYKGFDMKFGLYEVDFATQKRTLRPGSYCYRDIVHCFNALPSSESPSNTLFNTLPRSRL